MSSKYLWKIAISITIFGVAKLCFYGASVIIEKNPECSLLTRFLGITAISSLLIPIINLRNIVQVYKKAIIGLVCYNLLFSSSEES